MKIHSLDDISRLAREKGPKTLAVLAPEDEEFMAAVKEARRLGFIEPLLIGDVEIMKTMAQKVEFDISPFETISLRDKQEISDLGIALLFSGQRTIASKGQIPTSFIYRSIIRQEATVGSGMTVSVVCFWEVPGVDHLVALTDTGVNIAPNVRAKAEILKNAVFVCRLLGYEKPKIAILSGRREIGGNLQSFKDFEELREYAALGKLGVCEMLEATSFTDIFLGQGKRFKNYEEIRTETMPHILLVPSLDAGNIICKLDFFLDVTRSALVATSRGPVCIPARSDLRDNIVRQLATCVVLADRMEAR